MRFNFRHNQDHPNQGHNACPITWAVTVPVRVSVDTVPTEIAPRALSTQELSALILELGREGLLSEQQIRILSQSPELAPTS